MFSSFDPNRIQHGCFSQSLLQSGCLGPELEHLQCHKSSEAALPFTAAFTPLASQRITRMYFICFLLCSQLPLTERTLRRFPPSRSPVDTHLVPTPQRTPRHHLRREHAPRFIRTFCCHLEASFSSPQYFCLSLPHF